MFEFWPFTNFHQLNLDWIIKEVKENNRKVEEFAQQLEEMGVTVAQMQQYIDNLDDHLDEIITDAVSVQVPQAIHNEIESGGFDVLLTTMRKRRFVVIGDSYGAGWTPDGDVTSFATIIKNRLHIADADFFQAHKGGGRFGDIAGSEYAFDTVLAGLIPSITDPDSITDIIFAGGYNEGASTTASINDGINRCKILIDNTFHNNSLRVHLFAIGYSSVNPAQREALFYRYNYCYARSGWAYTNLTKAICYNPWWASDGYHPLQHAQDTIAQQIMNVLRGGTVIGMPDSSEYAATSQTGMTFYSTFMDDCFDSMLYGQNINLATRVTINKDTPVKILDITSNYPLCNTADNSKLEKWIFPAILEIGGASFKNATLIFHIKQESRTTYGLYVNTFMLNDAGTNYAVFNDVSAIQMLTNSFHVRIPYKF